MLVPCWSCLCLSKIFSKWVDTHGLPCNLADFVEGKVSSLRVNGWGSSRLQVLIISKVKKQNKQKLDYRKRYFSLFYSWMVLPFSLIFRYVIGSIDVSRSVLFRYLAPIPTLGPFPGKPFSTVFTAHLFHVRGKVGWKEAGGKPFLQLLSRLASLYLLRLLL